MGVGGSGSLLGVALDSKVDVSGGRPQSHFDPETVSDAAIAAAGRRGLDDVRGWDEVRPFRRPDGL
jgi:hypothetical protein